MKTIYFCIFYLLSYHCFSQHGKIYSSISLAKNTDEKIRLFVSYLDDTSLADSNTADLNIFFQKLKETEPSIGNYVDFQRQLMLIKRNTHVGSQINNYTKLAKNYKEKGEKVFEGVCYMQIAQQQLNLKNYSSALNNALIANELFKRVGYKNIPEIGKYLHGLALIHFFFKDYDKVVDLMTTSYKYPLLSKNLGIQRENNLGHAFMGLNKKKVAYKHFISALKQAQNYNDSIWIGLLSGNIGDLYQQQGKYNESLTYYTRGLAYVNSNRNPGVFKNLLLKVSKGSLYLGDITAAKRALNEYNLYKNEDEYFMGISQQQDQTKKLYFEVNKLYALKIKNYKEAYSYADSLFTFTSKHDSIYNKMNIDISYYRVNNEKQLLQLQLKEYEKKKIFYRYTILIFILLILSVFGYLFMKRRKDLQKKIFLAKENSMKQRQLLLTEEVFTLKKDIQSHLFKIKENNNLIDQYNLKLQNLERSKVKPDKQIEDTRIDIDNLKILTKEHWENFLTDFKASNKRFYNLVVRSLPDLTQSEQRLLFLVKLGIPQKNLSNVIGTSDGNIRVILHRLKAKINDKEKNADIDKIISLLNRF